MIIIVSIIILYMNSLLDQLLLCALLLSFCAFLSSAVVCEDQSVLHGI